MISVNNLSVAFGVKPLFSDVSFVVNDKERVCLVGKNGAGKSTLLKILSGQQRPTTGTVSIPTGQTIGYLPQVMKLVDGRTVREEAALAFEDIKRQQEEIDRIGMALAERTDYESEDYGQLTLRLATLTEHVNMMGGGHYEAELERTLTGLGFEREELDRQTSELSGGWRMRVELAKLLLRHPDILLLDEPTNHLDIWSIEWLEDYLKSSPCALVLVSHDRTFINHTTDRTLEINCGKLIDYHAKYNEYVKLRAERREQQLRAYENQQKEIADIKDFIERFRYKPTKAVQVQSRIKQLERIVPIEVDEVDTSRLHLKFAPCLRSGDYPLICKDMAAGWGDHTIVRNVNLTIKRGEKVALVGRNGEGKSTLVKCIMQLAGQMQPGLHWDGTLKIGHNVQIGYFAQNEAQMLDEDITVYDTIDQVATGDVRLRIKDLLGAFMFGGEASDKLVKVLSGGERTRLAMLRLLLKPVNLLILDEPTNHLDMRTKDVLKEAVKAFDGTAIIVSHDRDFLDGLVEKVYEVGGGKIKEHLCGIYEFLQEKKIESLGELDRASQLPKEPVAAKVSSEGKLSYEQQKEQRRKMQKLERQVVDSERQIGDLEAALHLLEDQMATPEGAADSTLAAKHQNISQQLDKEMENWTQLSEELEQIKQQ